MKAIAELLANAKHAMADGVLELYVNPEKIDALYSALQGAGYKRSRVVDRGEDGECLSVNLDSDSWQGNSPFFPKLEELWRHVVQNSSIPGNYYVLDGAVHSGQETRSEPVKRFEYYLGWRALLSSLKDHIGSQGNDSTLIYFISTEKGAKIYEINPRKISLDELMAIPSSNISTDEVKKLQSDLDLNDGHQKERRDVLRTSLSELLEEEDSVSEMPWIIKQGKRLKKKYQENYDIYLHKFSVNKLLAEIEEKSTDYISKINESISSSQSKAFAIPGAIIAIAALIKNTDSLALFLVCFGLLCVWLLTVIANNIHDEAYAALGEQVQRSLKRYEVMKDENEVRVSAGEAKSKLLGLIGRSRARLKFINGLSMAVFLLGCVYSVCVNDKALAFLEKIHSERHQYFRCLEDYGSRHRWADVRERLCSQTNEPALKKSCANAN
ncbi:hypothetical protein [Pseudomonas sp. Q1-7]|uniref:hypothetical protein n=1 Tax=Pseudomonas sp. Q1-7 TaxID=3020843 RepID=UPI0022FFF28D|nr:hypothetical protein [Pseudomonas sp. Q1-7]